MIPLLIIYKTVISLGTGQKYSILFSPMNNDEICFIDVDFITRTQLTLTNVLDYFSSSPFYDKTCNNEILKMQYLNCEVPTNKLSQMRGARYEAREINGTLTIEKILNESEVIEMFIVLNNHIFMCPLESKIYKGRVSNFLFSIYKIQELNFQRNTPSLFCGAIDFRTNEVVDNAVSIVNDYGLGE